nr:salivary glue protein Sgs-3-like isoform X2 [Penaeus vannamei]
MFVEWEANPMPTVKWFFNDKPIRDDTPGYTIRGQDTAWCSPSTRRRRTSWARTLSRQLTSTARASARPGSVCTKLLLLQKVSRTQNSLKTTVPSLPSRRRAFLLPRSNGRRTARSGAPTCIASSSSRKATTPSRSTSTKPRPRTRAITWPRSPTSRALSAPRPASSSIRRPTSRAATSGTARPSSPCINLCWKWRPPQCPRRRRPGTSTTRYCPWRKIVSSSPSRATSTQWRGLAVIPSTADSTSVC